LLHGLSSNKRGGNAFACICLSVCSLARLLKNVCMDLDEMLRCFIRFRISHATRNFTSGKSDVYVLVAAARHGFKMVLWHMAAAMRGFTTVLFTEAVSCQNTFVGRNYVHSTECPFSFCFHLAPPSPALGHI